ncbi:hypothetical protein BDW59DRAFT_166300 [Aspergillus cavernicola]|uniref:ubiquitinyl hydrolase 1 n=1 Tax=Aspergillus cavernicola TaxID=176166 RepID=A0ABR4HM62_9EURO
MSSKRDIFAFNHVFLPPKLPAKGDCTGADEILLLDKSIRALHDFRSYLPSDQADCIMVLVTMLSRLKRILDIHGSIIEVELQRALACLVTEGGFLPIHIREQNAAILMSRIEDKIHIELWELSPRNEAVTTTLGRLKRQFPGPTLAMDLDVFRNSGLQETMAQTLAKLSHQSVPGTKSKVKKSGAKHDEDRDTTHPKMVTEFFMAFLRPMCGDTQALQIQKNTREEVLWLDSRSPWRRSPLWLLIRVVLQLAFRRLSARKIIPNNLYKQFMVYLMSFILFTSQDTLPSENLHCMTAKICRRLHKLHLSYQPAWFELVQRALTVANERITTRWHNTMKEKAHHIDISSLAQLDFSGDVACTLSGLDQYLEQIQQHDDNNSLRSVRFHPISKLLQFKSSDIPTSLQSAHSDYTVYNLAVFEDWVSTSLDGWLELHVAVQSTCGRLAELIKKYHAAASDAYSSSPEGISIMLLTILELWIACDKSAVNAHRILSDYDPCIPISMFQSLLLPFQSQMERLARAEEYLNDRNRRVKHEGPGVFRDFGTTSCFSVSFFDGSDTHQKLYDAIEECAARKRQEKCSELCRMHERYRELYRRVDSMECTYNEVLVDREFNIRESRHSNSCIRCEIQRQADSMEIMVHEWPLPADCLRAKSTVFELQPPQPFTGWREASIHFILSVLRAGYLTHDVPAASYRPKNHNGLSSVFAGSRAAQRIEPLSQNKPHEGTHRKKRRIIDVRQEDVCLDNGMRCQYFDNTAGCFVSTFETTHDTAKSCMVKLPPSSSSLQEFLFRPADSPDGQPPNMVIASQDGCPKDMSLGEYKSLCVMPLGINIQWQNILRQLAMPSIVFKKSETFLFILQIINQAGPSTSSSILRKGHKILNDEPFALPMLDKIKDAAVRIEQNWESAQELSILISILSRVLSLSSSTRVQSDCLNLQSKFRKIAFQWVKVVAAKSSSTTDEAQRADLIARSAQIALICMGSFESEGAVLRRILQGEDDAAVFLQCCMIIHNTRHVLSLAHPVYRFLYHRWQMLCLRGSSYLANEIIENRSAALDIAIRRSWTAYRASSGWTAVQGVTEPWLSSYTTYISPGEGTLLMHFNLLTGELLINGLPLARLPADYERHESYNTLFGKSLLEVMPSTLPGMDFSCQRTYMGYETHLKKKQVPGTAEFDLCVRGVTKDQSWEFIPRRLLIGLVPDAFVENYAHWYNLNDQYVEFRPVDKPWHSSNSHWQMRRNELRTGWHVAKGEVSLINVRSPTAQLLSEIFEPIEQPLKLHCKLHHTSSALEIEIPRLRLGFDLQSGSSVIQSRQYRGMSIEMDQVLGTLIGLHNKLILASSDRQDRVVLIPEGPVSWEQEDIHIRVNIGWEAITTLHPYLVKDDLGYLADNGSLQSKLILCYMHALTSFCLPDPLTQKTGTEQALSILRSASLRSFAQLQPENAALLAKIAQLTPERRYYPANERVMQSVQWQKGLGFLTQHADFRKEVALIFQHDCRMGIFHPTVEVAHPPLPFVVTDLQKRDRIRSSIFRTSTFGAEDHTGDFDHVYSGLDAARNSTGASRVFQLCKIIQDKIPSARPLDAQELTSKLWKFLSHSQPTFGADALVAVTEMKYDASLLVDPNRFVASNWCRIHKLLCSESSLLDRFQLMIWLSTMAFAENPNMLVLETVASFYVIREMASICFPEQGPFTLSEGHEFNWRDLSSRLESARSRKTPASGLVREPCETPKQFKSRYTRTLEKNRTEACDQFLRHLELQWPVKFPSSPCSQGCPRFEVYFDKGQATLIVRKRFNTWFNNRQFRRYLTDIAQTLAHQPPQSVVMPNLPFPRLPQEQNILQGHGFICVDDLLDLVPPMPQIKQPNLPELLYARSHDAEPTISLNALLQALALQSKSQFEEDYVGHLRSSVRSLQVAKTSWNIKLDADGLHEVLSQFLHLCEVYTREIYTAITSFMMRSIAAAGCTDYGDSIDHKVLGIMAQVTHWPRVSSSLLLEQLTRHRWHCLPSGWKSIIIAYGCSITTLQWARRLVKLRNNRHDLVQELQNPGHTNWDPHDFPETLLLEIEHEILVRDVQEQIARQMRTCTPGRNVVMQLNMGEGKSSVIVPIVAAANADGVCLVRVLVAKPQSRQMLQMLISKLGGRLGRRVYLMPISRSLLLEETEANQLLQMCLECIHEGGVLLVQPEHMLSLKLMCIECFNTGREGVGQVLLKILELFLELSRDIIDESDENFSVKFELVYTMGAQSPLELSPDRWIIIHQLLDLVRMYGPEIKKHFPQSVELEQQKAGNFARLRLLHGDASESLLQRIGQHICDHGIASFTISRQPEEMRRAVLAYLLDKNPTNAVITKVEEAGFWTDSSMGSLFLLRGVLAQGVLQFCFGQKRWRVNYGPDSTRVPSTRLSVPYHAKDNPAPRSEFSHADVVIILTSLSYYYSGLTDDELYLTFDHLLKSDQADTEYHGWVADAPALPPAYHHLVGINLEDPIHCSNHVFPKLRAAKAVIDYFLASIVFPKELREFPHKLSSSGWDLGEVKTFPTVGFSGTNDSRLTLPLTVEQLDLSEQNHTNALVLEYLLRPENSVTFVPPRVKGSTTGAQILLELVSSLNPPAQVILDVGAQILELSNRQLAKHWLGMVPNNGRVQAVVFVDERDEICVLDRHDRVESLQVSPFAQQLEACFVFLDEAHTRGIDLKLPQTYRAAVTLGAGVAKDKLVQACMRMRKLGKGQSVVFCAPDEIKDKILSVTGKQNEADIEVSDVLRWAVSETWLDLRRSIPLWAIQGERFAYQRKVWYDSPNGQITMSIMKAQRFLEPESQSLESRYRARRKRGLSLHSRLGQDNFIDLILARCREFDNIDFTSTQLQEEQERELAPEIEQERQIQRPPRVKPKAHHLHVDLISFISTGIFKKSSGAYGPAFESLRDTSAAAFLDVTQFPSGLFVTTDFAETVQAPGGAQFISDSYQRSAQWVLTSTRDRSSSKMTVENMLVISPFEANQLHERIRSSTAVQMHLYAPRQSQAHSSLDTFALYNVPASYLIIEVPTSLRIQLNLFSGQLYMSSYKEYQEVCDFLGVASVKTIQGQTVALDGFILESKKMLMTNFDQSPLTFLRVLMSLIRKECQKIGKTHMGKLLDGKLLSPSDFSSDGGANLSNKHLHSGGVLTE